MNNSYEKRGDGKVSSKPFSRTIEGYAAVFNKLSNPMSRQLNGKDVIFREMILPGAFNGLIDTSDVVANFNHEEDAGILARSRNGIGSLQLSIDDYGLRYSFDAPDTSLGNDVLKSLKRGDIDGSSFQFRVAASGEKWVYSSTKELIRSISKIAQLIDVSLVVRTAYEETFVSLRGLNINLSEYYRDIEGRIAKTNELNEYYRNLKLQYRI